MKVKKVITLGMVSALLVSAFVGCTREVPDTEPTTADSDVSVELVPEEGAELVYWAEKDGFEPIAEAFTEKYGVPVTIETVGFDSTNKLMLEGPAGNAADVIYTSIGQIEMLSDAGVIAPINTDIAKRVKDTIQDTAYTASSVSDELYAVPMTVEALALFYNKDTVSEIPETFEEILDTAKQELNASENEFYYLMTLGAYNFQFAASANGQYYFGEDGKQEDNPGLDSPEMVETLKFVESVSEAMPIPAADLQMEGADFLLQNFMDGKTQIMLNGPWAISTVKDSDINYGVAPLPTVNGETAKPFLGGKVNVVSEYTEYPIAAQLFAEFMVSEEAAGILYNDMGEITSRKDISNIEGLADDEVAKAFVEQFENTVMQPNITRMNYIWSVVDNGIISVFDDQLSPEECATKMQEDFDTLVVSE